MISDRSVPSVEVDRSRAVSAEWIVRRSFGPAGTPRQLDVLDLNALPVVVGAKVLIFNSGAYRNVAS